MDEVLLQPGIDAQDGDGGEHDDCRFQRGGQAGRGEALLGGHFHGVDVVDDVVQQQLQGIEVGVLHVHQGVGVAVPAAHGVEQSQGGQHGGGQRDVDLPQHLEEGGAVDLRRFPQTVRDSIEEAAHDDHVVDGQTAGDNQHQGIVQQAQLLHQQVVGDGACVEEHGDGDEDVDEAAALELLEDQGVCAQHGHGQRQQGAHHGEEHGPEEGLDVLGVLQDGGVSIKVQALGNEADLVAHQIVGAAEGLGQQVNHGQQADGADENTQKDKGHIADFCRGGFYVSHYQIPLSPSFLDSQLAISRKNTPTTDWNRPTAVVRENCRPLIPVLYT